MRPKLPTARAAPWRSRRRYGVVPLHDGARGASLDGLPGEGAAAEGDINHLDVENLEGSLSDALLIGNDSNNRIQGGHLNDVIYGRGGRDVLLGDRASTATTHRGRATIPH